MSDNKDDNLMAAFCYWGMIACCFIPALVIFFIKKDESEYVKFHAFQSFFLFAALFVVSIVTSILAAVLMVPLALIDGSGVFSGLISMGLNALISLCFIGYLIYLGVKALNGEEDIIPFISSFVREKLMG